MQIFYFNCYVNLKKNDSSCLQVYNLIDMIQKEKEVGRENWKQVNSDTQKFQAT